MNTATDLGFLSVDDYKNRRSERLNTNPNASLDEKTEVCDYISKLAPDYLEEIKKLSSMDVGPLTNDVRVLITIIAYGEGTRIRNTLDNYVKQDLPKENFEIIILDNHPENVAKDSTEEEVEKFKQANPNITVVYAHKVWLEGERATVGNARKYVFDIGLYRIFSRAVYEKETILVSNDADTVGFDDNYLSEILNEFDSSPVVDGLVTRVVVPKKVILKPNIYAVLSLWDALDEVVAIGEPYNLRGASSAYRASIYTAVGGYNPNAKQAEDLETGVLISDARCWNPKSVIQLNKTKLIQDPRRILMAVSEKVPVNEMYFDFTAKPEIRNASNDTLLSLIPEKLDWEQFEEDADSFWQGRSTGMYKWRGDRFENDFNGAMNKIGVEYEIVNDRVKLKNIDRLTSNFQIDFGNKMEVIHSTPRVWDQKRQDAMKDFFLHISDGIIESRRRMAERLLREIENSSSTKTDLLKEYKRFSGKEYFK